MLNRRSFLKGAVASAPLILSSKAFGQDAAPPSEQVKVGLIGLGGRCKRLATHPIPRIPGMRVVAVCDCFQPRIDAFLKATKKGGEWKGYTDFREMIETEKLDAVMVETTTHA
ncbi:MAG: gfo/Idh/MocA family oxidoreductase, partial [bacterium]|nr:gfo/Idh/MocA family oxidoreductase [bacterium]